MAHRYVHRDTLKAALGILASTTGQHEQLDDAAETVSLDFDDFVGFSFQPASGARDYTPRQSRCLALDTPLTAVDAIRTTSDGTSYGTTFAGDAFHLTPYNATMESPRKPFWGIELKASAAAVFPAGTVRGARVLGTWGYYDERKLSAATLATALDATATTVQLNGATALHAGQTILMGGERMLVTQTPASSTGSITSAVTVERGQHGTSGATHSCATTIEVYRYPIIERLALYQAEADYRAMHIPLGYAGGGDNTERPVGGAGLHPFVRKRLERFRSPTVA